MRNLTINGERLWASLMELARIGATAKGGVCRLAASELDGEARRLFIRWCEEAGCTVAVDKIDDGGFRGLSLIDPHAEFFLEHDVLADGAESDALAICFQEEGVAGSELQAVANGLG